jgi:hypothetical protein
MTWSSLESALWGYDKQPARLNGKEGSEWKVLLVLSDHEQLIGIVAAKPNQLRHARDRV